MSTTEDLNDFEGFYGGPENRLALETFSAVAKRPALLYSPIYLHGTAGVGKTCLVSALVRRLRRSRRTLTVHRLACGSEAHHEALRRHASLPQSAQGQPHACLLIVEAVDQLSGHAQAQRALIAILDAWARRPWQVVLTAAEHPWSLAGVDARLLSRFVSGLVLRLDAPGPEVRQALLESIARRQHIPLPASAARRLAWALPASTSALQQTLLLLDDAARLEHQTITVGLVDRYVAALASAGPSVEQIARRVASHFDIDLAHMRSGSRAQAVNQARQVAMYLARRLGTAPTTAVARFFHNRHRSTVDHACRKLKRLRRSDAQLRAELEILEVELGSPSPIAGLPGKN